MVTLRFVLLLKGPSRIGLHQNTHYFPHMVHCCRISFDTVS